MACTTADDSKSFRTIITPRDFTEIIHYPSEDDGATTPIEPNTPSEDVSAPESVRTFQNKKSSTICIFTSSGSMTQSAAGFIAGQPLSIIEDLRDRAAARRERPGTSRQTSYAFFGRAASAPPTKTSFSAKSHVPGHARSISSTSIPVAYGQSSEFSRLWIGCLSKEGGVEVPVWLEDSVSEGCYDDFCHLVLWPALHYAVPDALETRLFHESASYKQYANANWPFTQRIGEVWKGDGFSLTLPFHPQRDKPKGPRPPLPPVVVDITAPSVPPDGLPPSSPSSIRWNSLRQHVFPPLKSTHSQQSSSPSTTSISVQATSRTGHAKQSSKFAQRLGFRNVVDQAKQVMVDEIQQLTHDIQRACMAAYHIELPPSVKSRIDPLHIPVDSTLSLPFISSTNLTVGGITRSANSSRSDLQQPSVSLSIAAGRVRPLYQTLINHAGPFADGSYPLPQLPLESLVISTLLIPFLTTDSASATEEDRWLSIEAFQIVVKTWNPTTEVRLHCSTHMRTLLIEI
ncbi:hypothetical protein HHX47_DHR7000699 [Lentinula edodes]|nr:hypothetical protein HHX47_DHR7000699 [Lentinula edodes]